MADTPDKPDDKVVPLRPLKVAPAVDPTVWVSPVEMLKNVIRDIEDGTITPDGVCVLIRDVNGIGAERYPSYWMDLNELEVLGLLTMGAFVHVD